MSHKISCVISHKISLLIHVLITTGGIFHWNSRNSATYSLDPAKKLPLYADAEGDSIFNWIMIYILDSLDKFQNLQSVFVKSSESIHDKIQKEYPGIRTEGRVTIPTVPVFSKQILAYFETLGAVSPYLRQDNVCIATHFDMIYAANLSSYEKFGNKELHAKIAGMLAKWVEMFPHKDEKVLTVPDDDDEGGDDDAQTEESGGASATRTNYALPASDDDE